MSTDRHNLSHGAAGLPVNADVSFEERDVNIKTVVYSLIYLAVAVAISFAICVAVFNYTTKLAEESDVPPPPIRTSNAPVYPPEPRLQGVPGHETDPQADLRNMIQQDTKANETLGWVDKTTGIAQIPVKDAMKIIAEKGLGGAPAPAEKKQ